MCQRLLLYIHAFNLFLFERRPVRRIVTCVLRTPQQRLVFRFSRLVAGSHGSSAGSHGSSAGSHTLCCVTVSIKEPLRPKRAEQRAEPKKPVLVVGGVREEDEEAEGKRKHGQASDDLLFNKFKKQFRR